MNRISLVFFISIIWGTLNAQTINDALRYSFLEVGGTARSIGIGGSMSALGADYATLSTNPAGLAMYRSSEFVITPTVLSTKTASTLEGNSSIEENSFNFGLDNIGIVFASQPRASNWKTLNLGIGMNKLANFSQEFRYEGISKGSIVDRWTELANGFESGDLYPYEEGLAFRTEAIYGPDADLLYGSDFMEAPDAEFLHRQTVTAKGKYNEMLFALGANYDNKLMTGLTIGVPFVQYSEEKVYEEENNEEGSIPNFIDLRYSENLRTNGVGINVKLGLIYRISQEARVGFAWHSPTFLGLTDRWDATLNYDYTFDSDGDGQVERYDNTESEPESTPYEYKLRTPGRLMVNGGVIIRGSGFISAEVEYVDYSKSKFDLTVNSYDESTVQYEETLNEEIGEVFTSALNIRFGAEYAYEKYRFRAGYGIIGTPYADESTNNSTYSFGFGVREKKGYLDLAYKRSSLENSYTPYRMTDASQEQKIDNEASLHKFILTIGFRF